MFRYQTQPSQINIARFALSVEHLDTADFMNRLDTVNGQADAAPGLVWPMVGAGNNAMDLKAVAEDPRLITVPPPDSGTPDCD